MLLEVTQAHAFLQCFVLRGQAVLNYSHWALHLLILGDREGLDHFSWPFVPEETWPDVGGKKAPSCSHCVLKLDLMFSFVVAFRVWSLTWMKSYQNGSTSGLKMTTIFLERFSLLTIFRNVHDFFKMILTKVGGKSAFSQRKVKLLNTAIFQGGAQSTLPLASGRSFGLSGTMSLAAVVPWLAVFALRCLFTVTIELAMFYCQFQPLCGCCFALGVFEFFTEHCRVPGHLRGGARDPPAAPKTKKKRQSNDNSRLGQRHPPFVLAQNNRKS